MAGPHARAAQQDHPVGEMQGVVGMVGAQEQGHAVGHQFAQQRQDAGLVLQVKAGGGLVQHQDG